MGEELSGTQNQLQNESFGGDANSRDSVNGLIDAGGTFRHYLTPKSAGLIFKAFQGAPTTTGAGDPYTHVFKTTTGALPTLSVETYFNLATDEYKCLLGGTADTLGIEVSPEGFLLATVGFAGKKTTVGTSPFDASTTDYTTDTPFHHLQIAAADVNFNGADSAVITAVKFNIDNRLKKQIYTVGNSGYRYAITRGRQAVTGSITVLFEDLTHYTLASASTFTSIDLKWTSGTSSLKIELPRILLKQRDPVAKDDGPIMIDYEFTASKDATAATQLKTTLLCPIATY